MMPLGFRLLQIGRLMSNIKVGTTRTGATIIQARIMLMVINLHLALEKNILSLQQAQLRKFHGRH